MDNHAEYVLIESYTSVHYECPRCYNSYELKLETEGYPAHLTCPCGENMRIVGKSITESAQEVS